MWDVPPSRRGRECLSLVLLLLVPPMNSILTNCCPCVVHCPVLQVCEFRINNKIVSKVTSSFLTVLFPYFSCILMNERGCTPLTCLPTNRTVVNPSPSDEMACQKEKNMVQTCYATMGSCFSCIFTTFEPLSKNASVTCSEFASEMCPAIATECDCGLCRRDLEEVSSNFRNIFA
jgi:hypothetical protein